MALFGKKEPERKAPGVQTPQISKALPKEQKKLAAKGTAGARTKDTSTNTTYLGKNLQINGNISGEGSLLILGTFEGEFDLKGQLEVAQGAVIKGNINATGVSINGNVNGTVVASERIVLETTASIKGRLVTPKISIQDGAVIDGELQMSTTPGPAPKAAASETKLPPKAPPVSEIK